jgi:outer membrane protein
MKYLNTIFISLLFIAVTVLFYLHFKTKNNETTKDNALNSKSGSIAYVNIDSLFSKMELYKDTQAQLAKKQQDLESNFAVRYKSFENNVNEVQKRFSDPTAIITQVQKDQIDQQLSKQKSDLENLQNNYMTQMQQESASANKKIIEYIMQYLKDYTMGKNIQYILSYGFGGNILYTDTGLDLTSEILFGLNEKYLKEKSSQK